MLEIILGGGCIVLSLKCAMLLHELEETKEEKAKIATNLWWAKEVTICDKEKHIKKLINWNEKLTAMNNDLKKEIKALNKSDYNQDELIDDLYEKLRFKDEVNSELVKVNAQLKEITKLKNVGGHRTTIKSGDDNE